MGCFYFEAVRNPETKPILALGGAILGEVKFPIIAASVPTSLFLGSRPSDGFNLSSPK